MSRYHDYLRSPEWQIRRQWMLALAHNACQFCNATDRLQVHHRTYERLGEELPADLTVLCDDCHARHHQKLPEPPSDNVRTILNDDEIAFPTAAEARQLQVDAQAIHARLEPPEAPDQYMEDAA